MNKGLQNIDPEVAQKDLLQIKHIEEAKAAVGRRGGSCHVAVSRALKSGKLVRPDFCSWCGKKCKPVGHHPDYGKWLEVEWVCRSCHYKHHWKPRQCSDMMIRMNKPKEPHPNQELLNLIKTWGLVKSEVAALCRCGRTSVYSWTREPDHKDFFKMSDSHLQLLRLELHQVLPYISEKRAKNMIKGKKMRPRKPIRA